MKSILTYILILLLPCLAAKNSHAQLASERPLATFSHGNLNNGAPVKAPANGTKTASEKKMPVVKAPEGAKLPQQRSNGKPSAKNLPSNSRKPIKDLARKPKVKN